MHTPGEGDTKGRDPMADPSLGVTLKGFAEGFKVFDRYVLSRVLGRGGMGVVWLAHDEELEREVAIKFLPELVVLDREAIHELKRETRRSLELTHPHIVRIYDFEQDDQTAGITMEYIDGKTLSALKIEQPGRCLGISQVSPWIEQLCGALDYAHLKARVVHRDLKPANLMVTSGGDIKISDFGISCSISDSVSRISMVRGTSGTPVYMSPQQALGEKPTVQDDIYALGASIYDLLTGKPPFYSGDILTQLREISPPPMARRREDLDNRGEPIPEHWEQAIAACLSKDPANRPASAGEVAERLGLAPATSPTSRAKAAPAPPPLAPAPIASPPRAIPWLPVLGGALVLGLVAGMGLFLFNARRSARLQEEITRRNAEAAARLLAEREAEKKAEKDRAQTQQPLYATPRGAFDKREKPAKKAEPPPKMSEPPPPPKIETPAPRTPVAENPAPPGPLPEPETLKLHPPDQDSMATLEILVRFARDPRTPDKPAILGRIDRVITAYHVAQAQVKAVHVERWRAALEAAAELGSIPAQALISEGLAETDPVTAFKWGLKAAEAGKTRAMLDTGRRYRDGRGTQPDPSQARRWLRAAADAGETEARRVLAYALLQGIGMTPDPPAAVEMFRALADGGDPVAMDLLGTFYHKGLHGLAKDASQAFRLYSGASDLGNLDALANLGVLFIKGEGTATDPAKAAALFRKGAEAGNARCMELFAICLDEGIGVEKDPAAAETWRKKAAPPQKSE